MIEGHPKITKAHPSQSYHVGMIEGYPGMTNSHPGMTNTHPGQPSHTK